MSTDSHLSTILFFALGLLFVQICFVSYLITQRSKFIEYFVLQCEQAKKVEDVEFQTRCQAISIQSKQEILEENVHRNNLFFFVSFVLNFELKIFQEDTLENSLANMPDPQFGILTVDGFDDQQEPIIPIYHQYSLKLWIRVKRKFHL